MKLPLAFSIALPYLIASIIGIIGSSYILNDNINQIFKDEMLTEGGQLSESFNNTFTEIEHSIGNSVERFSKKIKFKEALFQGDAIIAQENLDNFTNYELPVQPALAYVNSNNDIAALANNGYDNNKFTKELILKIEERASLSSKSILSLEIHDQTLFFLIFSENSILESQEANQAQIRVVYEVGPQSALLNHLQTRGKADCIKVFLDGHQSKWNGVDDCENTLANVYSADTHRVRPFSKEHDDYILSAEERIKYNRIPLQFVVAQKKYFGKGIETNNIKMILFSMSPIIFCGLFSLIFTYQKTRTKITKLLNFIEHVDFDEEPFKPNFQISEFYSIAESHTNAQNKLIQLNHQLDMTNREQQELTYAISHDIKSPIITVLMLIDELELSASDALTEDDLEVLSDMKETSNRMITLVNSILSYARTVGEQISYDEVNLNSVVSEIIEDIQGDLSNTNGVINYDNLPVIYANAVQIRMLLQNLISNAIKFRREDRTPIVDISANTQSNSVERKLTITIKDNGIGISKEFHDKIFKLFARLHDYSTYQGSGIGLAVCQRIVSNHGGKIILNSKEGEGTTFTIILPVEVIG